MDTRRLILLMVFSFSLFMLWENWQKYNQPKLPATAAAQPASTVAPAQPPLPGSAQLPATAGVAPTSGETLTIKTDKLVATLSTVGGDLTRLELPSYRQTSDKGRDFVLFDSQHQYVAQSGLLGDNLPNHRTVFTLVKGATELADGQNELKVRLEAPAQNGVKVAKVYTFKRGSYQIELGWEIDNGSTQALTPHAYYQLQRDDVKPEGEARMVSTFTGPAIYTEAAKYQKVEFSDIVKGKAKFNNQAKDGWLAMVQHYFVAAWVPQGDVQREFYMRKVDGDANKNVIQAGLVTPLAAVAPGAKATAGVQLYAGPQEQAALKALAPGLDLVVDYGWLTVVAAPIFWALQWIHGLVGNWGWAIILLTIGIKLAFFKLSATSYRSMAKMRVLTPRLTALKERYGDDRQRMNQEMMQLYKTEKVNPLGGCLPILVQIPVFIALYWVLLGAVEMRDAPWVLWIKDLSSSDPYYVLPGIMMVSMLIQTKLNPTPPDPIQAKMMMIMPFAFGIMFFFFPAGLVLYWVVNNLMSIAQQWAITRMVDRGNKAANDAKA